MKHELKALFRVLLYLGIVVVIFSCIGRLLIATDPHGYIGIIFSVIAIYLSLIVFCAAYISSIVQFSRSMFTGEGYMTFSLPVTPTIDYVKNAFGDHCFAVRIGSVRRLLRDYAYRSACLHVGSDYRFLRTNLG